MGVVIEWWYVRRMVRRCEGWCVMRYMDQVWTDSRDVLVRVSMCDLAVLMGTLNEVALREREEGNVLLADMLWDLSDEIADVEVSAEADLSS